MREVGSSEGNSSAYKIAYKTDNASRRKLYFIFLKVLKILRLASCIFARFNDYTLSRARKQERNLIVSIYFIPFVFFP